MNGTNGLNMKLEMDQGLTGKMFTMTSILGKSQHLLNAAPATPTSTDSNGKSEVNHFVSSVPCMPCVHIHTHLLIDCFFKRYVNIQHVYIYMYTYIHTCAVPVCRVYMY